MAQERAKYRKEVVVVSESNDDGALEQLCAFKMLGDVNGRLIKVPSNERTEWLVQLNSFSYIHAGIEEIIPVPTTHGRPLDHDTGMTLILVSFVPVLWVSSRENALNVVDHAIRVIYKQIYGVPFP